MSLRFRWFAFLFFIAGCHSTIDPCAAIHGTCVGLTVTSSQIGQLDTLHIAATGAFTGSAVSSTGQPSPLPIHVALTFPSGVSGTVHLDITGIRGGSDLAAGSGDTNVVGGTHTTATVDIEPIGGVDGGSADLSADDGGAGDMSKPIVCDPAGAAGPQCVWRYQYPLPTGDAFIGIYTSTDNEAFAMTAAGSLLHRDASGWTFLSPTLPAGTSSFTPQVFAGSDNGQTQLWAAGGLTVNGSPTIVVLHSTDRGSSWTSETLPAGFSASGFYSIAATGLQVVIGGGNGSILQRTEAGAWVSSTKGTGLFFAALVSPAGLFVAGSGGVIWRADNNMSNWTQVATTGTTANLNGLCYGSNNGAAGARLWAVGGMGTIVSALDSNAASTWAAQTSNAGTVNLTSCAAINPQSAWVVGNVPGGTGGIYVKTTNGGTNWGGASPGPDTTYPFSIVAHSPGQVLTITGTAGVIQRSTDGGNTFVIDSTGHDEPFFALAGVAPGVVYAAGRGGVLYRTSDDGVTWTKLATGVTADLNAIWGSSASDVFVVGGGSTILHSTNGTTFNNYAGAGVPAGITFNDISGSAATGVFAVGFSGGGGSPFAFQVYKSTDDGASWSAATVSGGGQTLTLPTGGYPDIAVFGLPSGLWLGAENSQMFFTPDGTTWTKQTINDPTGMGANFIRIAGRAPHDLFALTHTSNQALLVHSTDGTTWTVLPATTFSDQQEYLTTTPSGNHLYTTGAAGFLVSTDSGSSFAPIITSAFQTNNVVLEGVFAFADNDVFVITNPGGIAHYGN